MSDTETAIKALGAFPLLQAAVAILVILAGVYVLSRGNRDGKATNGSSAVPQWIMIGPAHEAIQSVHKMAEQGRATNHILERIEDLLRDVSKEQREQTQLLELIRNESRLR